MQKVVPGIRWTAPCCDWLLLAEAGSFGKPVQGKTRVQMPARSTAQRWRKLLQVNGLERWPSG